MRLKGNQHCPSCLAGLWDGCSSHVVGVEYSYDSPNHYDGVSEWECPRRGLREGRWTHKILKDGESEPPYGGKP